MTVLVVGAGPTGLALAAQLRAFRAGFRTIDRQPDQVHESRALAIQPRTLEVLTGLGIADTLVEHGNPAVRLQMHTGTRTAQLPLFDIGIDDTAYPFLLFLSQAETENVLATHLARHGVTIERGIELTGLNQHPDHVTCTLRHAGGHTETVDAEYVVASTSPAAPSATTPASTSPAAPTRRPSSSRTVTIIHNMLHTALADAARKGTVLRNVADLADPPKPRASPPKKMRIWSPAQLRRFLAEIEHHRLHPAFYLAANTGMRRGEMLGLRWDDVDLDRARLSVRHQIVNVDYVLIVDDVKTATGRRTIDLDPRTVAVLRSWRKGQLEERVLCGLRTADDGLVFAKPDGSSTHPDLFSQIFDRHVAKSILPRIRLHDLRHTHASILLKAGVPVKDVSERLGHSNPAFTMTVYQHVLPAMQSDAAAKFSAEVFGNE
jgi:integrase